MNSAIKINAAGRYGEYGGCYIPEILVAPIQELKQTFANYRQDDEFCTEFKNLLRDYAGRPTPLTEVKQLSAAINGPRIFLKREDLLHTGAHKINNALGQCLLAKKLGKKRIIAETGAGQHGVATAAACAYLGLQCSIYMGAVDMQRQMPNVLRMRLLGAEVKAVEEGQKTLKDAVNAALRDWSGSFITTHYCLGSALGPAPFPEMVAFFHKVIGEETQQQCQEKLGRNPDCIVACVGGGSNAIGIFTAFLNDETVKLVGVEAGGKGEQLGEHAARFSHLRKGVLHGFYSYLLQDEHGQIAATHSISAGLDYPAVGPQHAALFDAQRVIYTAAKDGEVMAAFKLLSRTEGIIPAFESAHALAYVIKHAGEFSKEDVVVVNLSGRGDKDLPQYFESLELRDES